MPTRVAMTVKGKDGRVIGVVLSREARESLGVISLIRVWLLFDDLNIVCWKGVTPANDCQNR